ncbi:MAG: branched-chain amino acid transport system ATP-binding protein [Actinomycetota bacterium]|jgi:branched-chain amino acid transport system ATP-binding protein|nr:branched-chain amino acid transport system ATP-binding protein [Actinomycetota bacterium]
MLEVRDIHVSYGPVEAIRGVSLDITPGEIVALLGANGAGKSTTLRAIAGVTPPSSGTIMFEEHALHGLSPHRATSNGLVLLPEGRELFAQMSVLDNLRIGYWTKRKDKAQYHQQIDTMMSHFPILGERKDQAAGTLSGGEQQMLAVARALMPAPRLLLVDELSLGLAPMIVNELYEILRNVNADLGTSMLIVEQFVHMALENSNRAYVLSKGEVVMSGSSAELLSDDSIIATYLGGEATGSTEPEPPRRRRRVER